jgi:leucyl aminopeptidase
MFLKEFTGDTPWVHLDIAGTAWLARRFWGAACMDVSDRRDYPCRLRTQAS